METVDPREIAFCDQFCFRCQPALNLVSGQRPLVHIHKVGPSGYGVR